MAKNNTITIYDLQTGEHKQHPNKQIHHLYNLCWSPDGKWFLATVHAGMGYSHAILAIEADGMKVIDLNIPGCRPDISPDGTKVAWGPDDWILFSASPCPRHGAAPWPRSRRSPASPSGRGPP